VSASGQPAAWGGPAVIHSATGAARDECVCVCVCVCACNGGDFWLPAMAAAVVSLAPRTYAAHGGNMNVYVIGIHHVIACTGETARSGYVTRSPADRDPSSACQKKNLIFFLLKRKFKSWGSDCARQDVSSPE